MMTPTKAPKIHQHGLGERESRFAVEIAEIDGHADFESETGDAI